MGTDFELLREYMVRQQLEARGIADARVLAAFRKVPRHRFVEPAIEHEAYADRPLPISLAQTTSQPYIIARMLELCEVQAEDRVLEVGAGSGYQTALLAELARVVISIERLPQLAYGAASRLVELGYAGAQVIVGDGSAGVPELAPFDAIVVSAAAAKVPQPLLDQLAEGGRLVMPVGQRLADVLERHLRRAGAFVREYHEPCVFVRLIGRYGDET